MKDPLESPRKSVPRSDAIPARTLSYDTPPPRPKIIDRRKPERHALSLADMSRRLFESLDYEEPLDSIARLAMPELGAWCIVDVLDDSGKTQRLAIIPPAPDLGALANELELRYPPRATDL